MHTFLHYYLKPISVPLSNNILQEISFQASEKTFILDDKRMLKLNNNLTKIKYIIDDKEYPFNLSYRFYKSEDKEDVTSGSYIFRPTVETNNNSLLYSQPQKAYYFEGHHLLLITVNNIKLVAIFLKMNRFVEAL